MLSPGQQMECLIDNLGYQGEGIARVDGRVCFIPYSIPGETVIARIDKVHSSHAFASLLSVLTPSPERVTPPCPHFTSCGGCALQHLPYQRQLQAKQQVVRDNLAKIGKVQVDVQETIGCAQPWHYRNKTTWQAGAPQGQPALGFYAPKSNTLVPVQKCLIASHAGNLAADILKRWMLEKGIKTAYAPGPAGTLHRAVTRVNKAGDLMLLLAASGAELPHTDALTKALEESFGSRFTLAICGHSLYDEDIEAPSLHVLYGEGKMAETVAGVRLLLSPQSFLQVNAEVCEAMYAYALRQAIHHADEFVLDLYSGIGSITLAAAKRCRQAVGIELSAGAVADARQNAALNGIHNASFIQGAVENELPRLLEQVPEVDAIILDPPRKGLHPDVIACILHAKPQRVVYISCNPASQARDLRLLEQGGYRAVAAQPFDMFCQTPEIENVVTLVRRMP